MPVKWPDGGGDEAWHPHQVIPCHGNYVLAGFDFDMEIIRIFGHVVGWALGAYEFPWKARPVFANSVAITFSDLMWPRQTSYFTAIINLDTGTWEYGDGGGEGGLAGFEVFARSIKPGK